MVKIVGVAQKNKEVLLYYSYKKGDNVFFKAIASNDGFSFEGKSQYVIVTDEKNKEDTNYNWKHMDLVNQKDGSFALYRIDRKTDSGLNLAFTRDFIHFDKKGKITPVKEAFAVVPNMKFRNRYISYLGDKTIKLAYSGDFKTWKPEEKELLESREKFFDNTNLEVAGVFNEGNHILLLYYVKKQINGVLSYSVGAATFSKKDPTELIDRTDEPIWQFPEGFRPHKVEPLSCIQFNDQLILYWLIGLDNIYAVSCQIPFKHIGLKDKVFATLKRFSHNPIISPIARHPWESRATFNTAAIYENDRVHFVYRALGDSDLSVFGYATSKDGVHIDERSDEPIYIPRAPFETPGQRVLKSFTDHFMSAGAGGGYGGVEDPRITKVDDRFYMTYVAFDGASPPRVALTSIAVDDFFEKKWDQWEMPKLISAPGMVNKNAVIFPEKVNGKYVVFHRVFPNILIDFVDDLKFNDYLKGQYVITPRKGHWDSKKIGAGAPPLRTKDGWLFIYQSVGYSDPGRYKIGAMLLDINDPTKVLYRCNKPLIAPDLAYENEGHKAGVVYPCGAVIKDNELFVYYGGADTVICAATENLDKFLYELKHSQDPKLRPVRSPLFHQ
jgi:predicted GH43/DUF377 family glycosyl hydrolase